MNWHHFVTTLITVSSLLYVKCDDRIKSKIYQSIESDFFCFRRLNASHQIGCNSKEGGNVGVVYIIKNKTDIDYVARSGPHSPYVAVMPPQYFNNENMDKLGAEPDRISGIIIIDADVDNPPEAGYTPDETCPNENFGLYTDDSPYTHCNKQQWNQPNKLTAGLMFKNWPFPIFFIKNKTSIDNIQNCFEKFHSEWPLCAVQLISPMSAAKDTATCMRRGNFFSLQPTYFCDPLGGSNIFTPLLNTSNKVEIKNRSIVVVAARMDSFSLFDNISPGADSAISSMVTLLSIAHTLSSIRENLKNISKNVLFALFDGEAFDYIGSSRVVYDMLNDNPFPVDKSSDDERQAQLRLNHFSHFIELNQVGFHGNDSIHTLWVHKNVNKTQEIESLYQLIKKNSISSNLSFEEPPPESPLPPSSLQSFLKHDKNITGIVIANHKGEYTNKYYNSIYDDYKNLNYNDTNGELAQNIANIVTVMSNTIYELLTNETLSQRLTPNVTLIENLLECYLVNYICDLFKIMSVPGQKTKSDESEQYPAYVGVYHANTPSYASRAFTHYLLAYLTGEEVTNKTKEECDDLNKDQKFKYIWMAGPSYDGICIKSQAVKTPALSPAFLPNGDLNSKEYSTWVESQWKAISARIFIKPSPLQEWMTLITGLFLLIVSIFVVYFIDKKSSILFGCDDNGAERI